MSKTIEVTSSQSSIKDIASNLALYKVNHKKTERSKKSRASFETSLPFISPFTQGLKNVKINAIRKQSEQTQQQIIMMKARLHALKQMKTKIELKKQKSLQKIQLIQTVRERKNFQSLQKLKEKEKQDKQLQQLKQKAKQLREGLKRQISRARQTIYIKNSSMAHLKKQQQVGFSDEIVKKQQRQLQQKLQKIEKIRQQEAKHHQILKEFQQSRIKFAEQNHKSKAEKQLLEKEKKKRDLEKLKEQHLKQLEQLKNAYKQYEEIAKLNPQGEFNPKSSRVSILSKRHI